MTGIIVLCRFNSSRLPGKILKEIKNKPLLLYIIERLNSISKKHPVVVCTSKEITDDPIEKFCEEHKIKTYRGSLDNVAERFKNCAIENRFDNAVRINGDNLFLDVELISNIIESHEKEQFMFSSNVKERTYPKGMSVEIVDVNYYKEAFTNFEKDDLEHVMTYFYRQKSNKHKFHYNHCELPLGLNFAIDTNEDFEKASKIIHKMIMPHTDYGVNQIIELNKELDEKK